ncbi:hypothetical protein FHS02_002431 [Massilia umbonata]|uniref:Uncharacterized protein n=1 Tax=Pseudoduganella umbonata TaxID=864828 RepID=A0A7W5HC18_9BURK|nr:hypothetical protein [Pseudoduganella umbonata]
MAAAVRCGLEIDGARGSVATWTHMAANGAASDTIARVLASPRRRLGDRPYSSASLGQ